MCLQIILVRYFFLFTVPGGKKTVKYSIFKIGTSEENCWYKVVVGCVGKYGAKPVRLLSKLDQVLVRGEIDDTPWPESPTPPRYEDVVDTECPEAFAPGEKSFKEKYYA